MNNYLSVSGAVFFDGPTGFIAESFQDFVVVAVFRQLVVTVHSQAGVDLRGDGSSSPLSSLVVIPLLPRRHSRSRRHVLRNFCWSRKRRRFMSVVS